MFATLFSIKIVPASTFPVQGFSSRNDSSEVAFIRLSAGLATRSTYPVYPFLIITTRSYPPVLPSLAALFTEWGSNQTPSSSFTARTCAHRIAPQRATFRLIPHSFTGRHCHNCHSDTAPCNVSPSSSQTKTVFAVPKHSSAAGLFNPRVFQDLCASSRRFFLRREQTAALRGKEIRSGDGKKKTRDAQDNPEGATIT